jgi:aspartate 1-decarboxylase
MVLSYAMLHPDEIAQHTPKIICINPE